MAKLRYLDKADLAPEDRDVLERPINLNRLLAHSPAGRRAGLAMTDFIRNRSKLDPRLRELAILAVGYLARAPYEWSHHIKLGQDAGVSDADIAELVKACEREPSALGGLAPTVIEAAREMTLDGAISELTLATLRRELGEERLVELVIVLGHYNGIVRVLATLQVDVEPEYQPYLERFPLPA